MESQDNEKIAENKDCYQFINSYYVKERYNGREKLNDDALVIAYKYNGEQRLQIIENPKFSFYVAKPNIQIERYIDNLKIEDCDLVTINYKDLNRFLAKFNGREEEYFRIRSGRGIDPSERWNVQKQFLNQCQANPRLFGTDIDIEDYYKMEFVKKYGVTIGNYKKAVFDIETDGIGDQFQAKHPVNCLSYYDFPTDTFYFGCWDQPGRWPRFEEFKEMVADGRFEAELRADPEMNGEFEKENNLAPRKTLEDTKFVFKFFEDEFDLICWFFQIVHETSPDYAMAWNYTFDVLYMINRLIYHIEHRKLNCRVVDIICDPNVPAQYRTWRFEEDKSPRAEYYNKWNYFFIPGKTTYIDSMAMWADIRKSKGVEPSYSLDAICMKEMKKGKVNYYDIADNAAELPYKDFVLHAHYNIRDTFLLAELEYTNNDIDALMYKAEYTRIKKVTRQTATLKNAQTIFYFNNGLAIGNNHNAFVPQIKVSYTGAMVADIMNNVPIKTPLFPYPSSTIRPYVADNDLTSMYPMMMISHNIYKTTLIFHIMKIGNVNGDPNSPGVIDVNEAFDNYQCRNYVRWGHDYLQLPDTTQLMKDLKAELESLKNKEVVNA